MPKLSEEQNSILKKIFDSFQTKEVGQTELDKICKNEDGLKKSITNKWLKSFAEEISCLIDMVKAVARQDYTEISKGSLATIVFTLIYVFSPLDLIPDVVPGVGFLDDAGMVGLCLKFVHDAVIAYKEWAAKTGGVTKWIENKALSIVQAEIEPEIRFFCKEAVFWSVVGLIFSLSGILILFLKPFPNSLNNDIAFIIFDVTLIFTIVRIISTCIRYRKDVARFIQNWQSLKGEKRRFQRAIGKTILICIPQNSVIRFAIEKFGGVKVIDDKISVDDVFVIKEKLPLSDFNEHFPDLFSLVKHYIWRFRRIFAMTLFIVFVSSVGIGFGLKYYAISVSSDLSFIERLWQPFVNIWNVLLGAI